MVCFQREYKKVVNFLDKNKTKFKPFNKKKKTRFVTFYGLTEKIYLSF